MFLILQYHLPLGLLQRLDPFVSCYVDTLYKLTASQSKKKLKLFTLCQKPPDMPVIVFQGSSLEWVK